MEKNIFRGFINRFLHLMVQFILPGSTTLRPFIHKLRGVKIQGNIFVGDQVYIENAHPECVEIHNGVTIALKSVVIAHRLGEGKIVIEENAFISNCCIINAIAGQTLVIGKGAVLMPGAVVSDDVPPHTMVGGVPARPIRTITIPMKSGGQDIESFKKGVRPL